MSQLVKDPRIKLFGKTIQLPEEEKTVGGGGLLLHHRTCESAAAGCSMPNPPPQSDKVQPGEEDFTAVSMKTDDDLSPRRKPERIIPCPRCNSMDTKFCYFNNYNTNQPRHFCKNCQRYWTAGGTMRNVPVGAGRRKNKTTSSVAQFLRHQMAPTTFASSDAPPLCESLNIADNKTAVDDQSSSIDDKGPPLPHPWHSVQWVVPPPPFAYPVVMPLYSYPVVPWIISPPPMPPSPAPLGKHSRDPSEKLLWVPKTLRVEESCSMMRGIQRNSRSLFKAFDQCQSKDKEQETTSTVLQANPAALSRSLSFHETSSRT